MLFPHLPHTPHSGGHTPHRLATHRLPVVVAFIFLLIGGGALLVRADGQARDTIRKHHLADIEASLYLAKTLHGTYPPYEQATWCGTLSSDAGSVTTQQIEDVLRIQHEKYENPDKPFPQDPLYANTGQDYFYWKHSPTTFELYAVLEEAKTHERNSFTCPTAQGVFFDYGISSVLRGDIDGNRVLQYL